MQYYHDLITQKSWQLLLSLKKKYDFVLIGGWAVYLYCQTLKSKDIDLIINYPVLEQLKEEFTVVKNDRLKKYETKTEETDIDIYLPYYSELGLPADEVIKLTTMLENFKVPDVEILALLKAKALLERKNSVKGRKDLIDLVSLFSLEGFDFKKLGQHARKFQSENLLRVIVEKVKSTTKIDELNLNVHKMAEFKRRTLPKLTV
ncbi:hypothetical protein COV89_03640 [Candidatus Shapirobacteria bacterium CG11_big_fil_rev_8_21_14_0_20_40_12]|uniref:Nucleotidyl transferase AbiEii/AbiGii toxin family protein n=4 Tax=Bacteria candidate phyla TaxID=1783234 RepID=A0A2M8ETV5_9BACT|nr:MAG: hypothetical protein COV89_03640 [Candidatus Shapirobacteria bacterium CG11_big_fil_rev_8_21_14_0_20_40_12]PJC28544.1 MAG: hypothetical protein CO053_03945 [Candidatus Shapirobacteria bacterium CG_4_9_14_0_2_um_filter_40_11]PJC76501.1 MAG: hypothetical protein CO010_02545 [Candidatus Shapirobacteria bacterium CG_4_8_14_3_um_filter_39_11]